MPVFEYSAVDASGRRVKGSLAGQSEQAVLQELELRRLVPVSVKPQSGKVMSGPVLGGRVGTRTLGESYTQMADLLRAGVPLLRGLKLLSQRKSKPALAGVYRELAEAVERGGDLAGAMQERPKVFAPVHVAMVRAGEKGGFLEEVLGRLGTLIIAQAELRAKVMASLIYPAMLVFVGSAVMVAIFTIFVPQFKPMFTKLPRGMPTLTKIVFGLSDALTTYGLVTAIVAAAAGGLAWWAMRVPEIRARVEKVKVRAPVVGPLVRALATARVCQLLGAMLANGVPLLAALGIAKDAAGNRLMERAVSEAAEAVQRGEPLGATLARSGLFEDDVVEMITVGESANNLGDVLTEIARTLEGRVDRLLSAALRLVEPLLLLVIASVIGLVAAALILPMTQLTATAGG